MYSNAFQKRDYLDAIRCALISEHAVLFISCVDSTLAAACSVTAGRHDIVVEQSRKLVNAHQFNNEPFRILLASLASGYHATDGFLASTLSKHMLRELRAYDMALKNPDALRWNPTLKRFGAGTKAEEDDDADVLDGANREESESGGGGAPGLPSKENPIGVAIYGQICLAAKSYQSAICKYFGTCGLQCDAYCLRQFTSCTPTTTVRMTPLFACRLQSHLWDERCSDRPITDITSLLRCVPTNMLHANI